MRIKLISLVFILFCNVALGREHNSYESLPLNSIKPAGWLKNQLDREFTVGYGKVFDQIQPSLSHQVFGPNKVRNFRIDNNNDWMVRNETWWWGEHEGYWADAVIRNSFLLGNEVLKVKADSIVSRVLENQEEDGYIGIYEKGYRLNNLKGDNGELWVQSRMLNALLAYYEFTNKKEVLEAVVRAAKCTMKNIKKGGTYFKHEKFINGGGITHGLMFGETLEWLYRLTKDKSYSEFAQWLYNDYCSTANIRDRENQLDNLLDVDKMFDQHGVHVAEHARIVMWMSQLYNNDIFSKAIANQDFKFRMQSVPSGVLVSDEIVAKRYGTPDLPYEYCVITESIISNFSSFAKFKNNRSGDIIENLAFNAAMGARTPTLTEISYCSRDNRKIATKEGTNTRMLYSANHPNAACCNLNALKTFSYYVSNMWMKGDNSIVAACYGPSILDLKFKGVNVNIEEKTMYPFSDKVTFLINPDQYVEFTLVLRNPGWSEGTKIKANGATILLKDGFYHVSKKWNKGDSVEIVFDSKIEQHRALNNELYLQKGALLYALPIEHREEIVKLHCEKWATKSFLPKDNVTAETLFEKYKYVNSEIRNSIIERNKDANDDYPWDNPYYFLNVKFYTPCGILPGKLVPMGSTVLRKLTF